MASPSRRTLVWSGRRAQPEARRETRDTPEARRRIIARYASKQDGKVLFCQPSLAELAGEMPRWPAAGSDGKVIYPTEAAAEAAAREFAAIGADPQEAYLCPRSPSGQSHAHLTRMD